ncbi:MAG TPA: dienelactone hydrolase family protein [Candidatus Limnocylindrales bacterium]|nr:dienelactone hydrolase family protein [Candidatus Limnocylindrales bacterium]
MLADYRRSDFSHEGTTKPVYVRGDGPAVIVMHEIPGVTPKVVRFADWIVEAGFRVYMPLLVGEAGREPTLAYGLASIARVCVSREFAVLASNRSSPITVWLRALARHASAETGGGPVGALGMCFSGNFALAMMMEPCLKAPVLSQPSMPFCVSRAHGKALHVSPEELTCLKQRCLDGEKVLALRFKGDPMSPASKFETLRREIGSAFEGIELEDSCANPDALQKQAHSVLTEHLIDRDGEPTREAVTRVIGFFRERLRGGTAATNAAPAAIPALAASRILP